MIEALRFIKEKAYKQDSITKALSLNKGVSGVVSCVDGGSAIIIDGGTWLLSKLRVASVNYDNDKRVINKSLREDEYYTIIKNNGYHHNLRYKTDFNIKNITEAPAIVMKTREYEHALKVVKGLTKDSLLIMDGLLNSETIDQQRLLALLEAETKKRGINVIGLAKTFRQSHNGQNIIGVLLRHNKGKWLYKYGDYYIVKLHEQARHAYAFNYFKHTDIDRTVKLLINYSTDPSMLGYPYPLIRVDADARISSYERAIEINKARIISKKNGFNFISDETSTNMHSLMDKQKYK